MIRLLLLSLYCTCLVFYAFKDWYKSLCGLVLLMAVIEHPDMPRTILGIQGVNAWNLVMVFILAAWLFTRGREVPRRRLPTHVKVLLLMYASVVAVATTRLLLDHGALFEYTIERLVSEYVINTVKWVVPGFLFFYGCRSAERFRWGVFALLGIYAFLALQVIKWMPLSSISGGEELSRRSLKILLNEIGYHRVNLSMMFAGASWAMLAARPVAKGGAKPFLLLLAALGTVLAMGLTGGRAGYVTWVGVGLILSAFRWRRNLLLIPVVAMLVLAFVPGVEERLMHGLEPEAGVTKDRPYLRDSAVEGPMDGEIEGADAYVLTAGRNIAWRYVIAGIDDNPLVGYGREAMRRTGITSLLQSRYGESFPHPHNAYLEMLLDNGIVGLLLVLPFFLAVLHHSLSLFRDNRAPEFVVIGGITSALVLALMIASASSQTFYPREGSVGMWCAIGLMLRVYVERGKIGPRSPVEGSIFEAAP